MLCLIFICGNGIQNIETNQAILLRRQQQSCEYCVAEKEKTGCVWLPIGCSESAWLAREWREDQELPQAAMPIPCSADVCRSAPRSTANTLPYLLSQFSLRNAAILYFILNHFAWMCKIGRLQIVCNHFIIHSYVPLLVMV